MKYYMGDYQTQAMLLGRQLPGPMSHAAIERMMKRVARFYGVNNKYRGDGSRR